MARPLRIQFPGAVYHIMSRGNEKKPVFIDDYDRKVFLSYLRSVSEKYSWKCYSYCLMSNHYHLLVETVDGRLSQGMRDLNGNYTQYFNRKNRRVGHLFQGRYKSLLVQKENFLIEVCRYIILNPVRAGLVENPGDWKWSSYREMLMGSKDLFIDSRTILSYFGRSRKKARKCFCKFVSEGKGIELLDKVKSQVVLGSDEFLKEVFEIAKEYADDKEISIKQRHFNRPDLETLFPIQILKNLKKRNEIILVAVMDYGYKQREIADYLGLHYTMVSRIIKKIKVKT